MPQIQLRIFPFYLRIKSNDLFHVCLFIITREKSFANYHPFVCIIKSNGHNRYAGFFGDIRQGYAPFTHGGELIHTGAVQ